MNADRIAEKANQLEKRIENEELNRENIQRSKIRSIFTDRCPEQWGDFPAVQEVGIVGESPAAERHAA
jgi:hypothetical protein